MNKTAAQLAEEKYNTRDGIVFGQIRAVIRTVNENARPEATDVEVDEYAMFVTNLINACDNARAKLAA